jgi:pSer/pThr/pTyr-binding forkhead associated (FHA) protein
MAIDTGGLAAGGANNIGWLVPLDGLQAGELFELKKRCTVGSAPDCDVILKDPSISGRHAEFIPSSNGFRLNDLGSTNGTFVNDKRVSSHDLIDNDNVRLGRTNFKFKSMN